MLKVIYYLLGIPQIQVEKGCMQIYPGNTSSTEAQVTLYFQKFNNVIHLQPLLWSCPWIPSLLPYFSSVQLLSRVWLFATPWTAAQWDSLSITNTWNLLKLMFLESVMPTNHLILCHPLLLLPLIFASIRVFSNESVLLIRWPKYWSFSFSISPSNEYSGLISFRMAWLDLFAVQGTLKSLLQHHSSKALILQLSAFFVVQLSPPIHDYWKNHSFD